MTPIYLDHNATTPLLPEAWEAMRAVAFGNPSSAHHAGRQARRFLEDAREKVATLLGANPDEVLFTSGATEANNLAIFGLLREPPGHVLSSHLEHPCVVEPLKQLAGRGFEVGWMPVGPRGQVETSTVMEHLRDDTRLVCLMLANHETGAVQPVRHVAKKLPKHIPLHCDAAQAIGKIPVNFRDLAVTTLSASAHKFRGPKGVGLLLVKKGTKLSPQLYGGHQQKGQRPGTEPVALAVGLAAALEHAVREMDATRAKLDALRARLWERLRTNLTLSPGEPQFSRDAERSARAEPREDALGESPTSSALRSASRLNCGSSRDAIAILNGPAPGDPDGLPTTLNVSFPGCRADVLLVSLDLAGVACSTGSACSSGSLLPSPVLAAMGVPDDVLRSAIRFSLGATTTEEEIDDAARRIADCVRSSRRG